MKDKELEKEILRLEEELQKPLEKAKKQYKTIKIPEELNQMTKIKVSERKEQSSYTGRIKKEVIPMKKYYYAAVPAAAVILFTVGLNTSYSFANAMEGIPVIGAVAKVLTVRSYQEKDADKEINVSVPNIEFITTETEKPDTEEKTVVEQMIIDVNAEIDKAVTEYVEEAETRIEEYKQAFIETGGTEEEFAQKDIKVNVDYEVKCQNENYLSFVVTGDESWSGAYAVYYYYNLDMKNGQHLTLKDLLGDNYAETANTQIREEMEKRLSENQDYTYFDEAAGGFTTVAEDTDFYINEAENPVVVFEKYEVAPGFMGRQEFEIVK